MLLVSIAVVIFVHLVSTGCLVTPETSLGAAGSYRYMTKVTGQVYMQIPVTPSDLGRQT